MPDCSLFDIGKGVEQSWAAVPALVALIPADRLYFQRTAEKTEIPDVSYSFGDVSAYFGGTEYFSGSAYTRKTAITFKLTFLADATDKGTIAALINDTFGWGKDTPAAGWTIPNAIVLSAMPEVEKMKLTEERKGGIDLLHYETAFTLTLQCSRD